MMDIVQCVSCEGFGWFMDDLTDESTECDWCGGVGYTYRVDGVDRAIPPADYGKIADRLEQLETQRLREMGYQGQAKRPWEQEIRKDTEGGINPYDTPDTP